MPDLICRTHLPCQQLPYRRVAFAGVLHRLPPSAVRPPLSARELAAVPAVERAAHLALRRDAHAAYIQKGLTRLPAGFIGLDASRPWLLFWMTHSLALLQQPLPQQACPL